MAQLFSRVVEISSDEPPLPVSNEALVICRSSKSYGEFDDKADLEDLCCVEVGGGLPGGGFIFGLLRHFFLRDTLLEGMIRLGRFVPLQLHRDCQVLERLDIILKLLSGEDSELVYALYEKVHPDEAKVPQDIRVRVAKWAKNLLTQPLDTELVYRSLEHHRDCRVVNTSDAMTKPNFVVYNTWYGYRFDSHERLRKAGERFYAIDAWLFDEISNMAGEGNKDAARSLIYVGRVFTLAFLMSVGAPLTLMTLAVVES